MAPSSSTKRRSARPIRAGSPDRAVSHGSRSNRTGRHPVPIEFPIPFGTGQGGGDVSVQNLGNAIAYPRFVIEGPLSGPVVANVSQGKEFRFDSLTLAAGQTLTIETDPAGPRSAKVAGANVFGSLKVASSEFFGITPETTETIRYYAVSGYATGSAMSVFWRDAWIS